MAGLTQEELEAQWKRRDFIMLQRGSIEYADKIGIEIGRAEERLESARKMKQKGYSLENIIEITGLSREEVESV